MGKYIRYVMRQQDFRPVNFERVRWLNEKDYPCMRELYGMSMDEWNNARQDGYTYCAVLEEGKIITIAACWKYSEDKWEVAVVATRNGYENRGLAKQAVSFVADYILSRRKTPTLTTRTDNGRMRKAAEATGFRPADETE